MQIEVDLNDVISERCHQIPAALIIGAVSIQFKAFWLTEFSEEEVIL